MKNKKKTIIVIFVFVALFLVMQSNSFAEVRGSGTTEIIDSEIIEKLEAIAVNASLAGWAVLFSGLAIILFLLLKVVITPIFGPTGLMPFPDKVIFNEIPILDPNFTSPASGSITYAIKNIVLQTYNSFEAIAIAAFAIAAMVMGIRLALTVIATEKAKYKQAISKWVGGIAILFFLKYIIAGTFYLNEQIVDAVAYNESGLNYEIHIFEAIPWFGSSIGALISGTAIEEATSPSIHGYTGIVISNLLEGVGGNVFSSIVAFIIIGQTIAIIIMYFKRLFYAIFLGLIGPLIIAVDTVNKSMGMQSKIFSNWIKEFTITVFMQSLHAVFLTVILQIIAAVKSSTLVGPAEGIVVIILTTALVKFEKSLKGLFGIRNGMMGDIKGGTAKMFGAIHGVTQGVKAVADNSKKVSAAGKKLKQSRLDQENLQKGITQKEERLNAMGSGESPKNDSSPVKATNPELQEAAEATQTTSNRLAEQTPNAILGATTDVRAIANTDGSLGSNNDAVVKAINNIGNDLKTLSQKQAAEKLKASIEEDKSKLSQARVDEANAQSEYSSARLATMFGAASFVGGAAIGIGAEGDIQEGLLVGGYVTKATDAAIEKIGYQGARKTREQLYQKAKAEGDDNPDILQPKSKLVINPLIQGQKGMESVLEIKHMLQGTLTQELSKEMQNQIGKTVREEMKKAPEERESRIKTQINNSLRGYRDVKETHTKFKDSYKVMGKDKNGSVDNL